MQVPLTMSRLGKGKTGFQKIEIILNGDCCIQN